jgi:lipoyl(octanoyl) transferase
VTRHLWTDGVPRPGYVNMAVDLSLLDRSEDSGDTWLRLYQWDPACLSFGRHEPALRRYDVEHITSLGLDTVRRPTGGRAVWHARELTYAVTAPIEQFGTAQSAYLEIHTLMQEALGRLGIRGSLAPSTRASRLDAGACFSRPAGGEVLVNGQKIVGSAQLVRGTCLLQHGSIILENSQGLVDQLKRGAPLTGPTTATWSTVPLGWTLDPADLTHAVAATAGDRWGNGWQQADGENLLATAARYYPQFQSPEWTWIR